MTRRPTQPPPTIQPSSTTLPRPTQPPPTIQPGPTHSLPVPRHHRHRSCRHSDPVRWSPMAGWRHWPRAAAPPSHAAGSGVGSLRPAARRRFAPVPTRPQADPSRPCHLSDPYHRTRGDALTRHRPSGPVPPHGEPMPGTSGRPGTRSTGSTPPGAQRRAVPEGPPRNNDVDGRAGLNERPGRLRRRRTDTPGNRPSWAALARSSRR